MSNVYQVNVNKTSLQVNISLNIDENSINGMKNVLQKITKIKIRYIFFFLNILQIYTQREYL